MKNISAVMLARAGIIAALYSAITILLAPISYGAVQFRVAESLSVTAFFYPEAIIGLTVGCFIANFFGNGIIDIIFGTLATFISSLLTYFIGKNIARPALRFAIGSIFPVIINAAAVPFTYLAITDLKALYFISAAEIALGQFGVIYTLGAFLFYKINRAENSSVLKNRR